MQRELPADLEEIPRFEVAQRRYRDIGGQVLRWLNAYRNWWRLADLAPSTKTYLNNLQL